MIGPADTAGQTSIERLSQEGCCQEQALSCMLGFAVHSTVLQSAVGSVNHIFACTLQFISTVNNISTDTLSAEVKAPYRVWLLACISHLHLSHVICCLVD